MRSKHICDIHKMQHALFDHLRSLIPGKLLPEVAASLDISYDAAHRRVTGKTQLTYAEAQQLASYFGISLDGLRAQTQEVLVRRPSPVRDEDSLLHYLQQSKDLLSAFAVARTDKRWLTYSAKDIPLVNLLSQPRLARFKTFVWFNLLEPDTWEERDLSSLNWFPELDRAISELRSTIADYNVREIWNDTTITSTLTQVRYYLQAGRISNRQAMGVLTDLKQVVNSVKQQLASSVRYQLYHNELLILNNNVLVTAGADRLLLVPYWVLGFWSTQDHETTQQMAQYFTDQLDQSLLLNTSGARERNSFFNRMLRRIDATQAMIEQEL